MSSCSGGGQRGEEVGVVTRPGWSPPEIDLRRPSAARVYDFYLGGSHNFEVDRQMAREAIELWPDLPLIMQANRGFLRRAVRFLVDSGVTQFIDVGSGIPTGGNVHEVAQRANPGSRVVYVDRDPVAVAHSRAILAGNEHTVVVDADLRDPDRIIGDDAVRTMIDFERPVAVLLVAVLHFVSDEDEPAAAVAELGKHLVPGSYLAISHASADGRPTLAASHQQLYNRTATPMTMRTGAQVAAFFGDFELVPPGLVWLPEWRPEPGEQVGAEPQRMAGYAGVGRKT
jgi:SAM-dependent methyltransferase